MGKTADDPDFATSAFPSCTMRVRVGRHSVKNRKAYFYHNLSWLSLVDTIGGRQQWKTISALLTQLVKSVPSSMENAWVA